MPKSRRLKHTHRPSLISRLAKKLQGEPEAPRKRLWQDTLTAALLFSLGLWTAVLGLIYRSYLGDGFLWFETTALIVIAGGVAALNVGVLRCLGVVWPGLSLSGLDEEDFPALLSGMPFLVLTFSSILLMSACPFEDDLPRPLVVQWGICITGIVGGSLLFFLVPLAAAIRRAVRRREPVD